MESNPNSTAIPVAMTAGFTLQYGSYILELLNINEVMKMKTVAAASAAAFAAASSPATLASSRL